MNKKDEIEDSLEFINDMKLYHNIPSNEEKQNNSLSNPIDSNFINSYNIDNEIMNRDMIDKDNMIYQNQSNSLVVHNENSITNHRVLQFIKEVVKLMICVILAFFIAKLITTYVGQHTRVDGYSMENTLHNGDYLIIDKFSYHIKSPQRYDIIVFPYSQHVNYIKRIIGLPGETVEIKENKIFINGELLEEHYGKELIEDPGVASIPVVLGSDEYFVIGDNRNHSMDSRSDKVGTIVRDKIIGKAWIKVWPIKDFGVINHQ